MRTIIGSAAFLLMIATPTLGAGASSVPSALYQCIAKDAVSLKGDGTLGRDSATGPWRKQNDNIIVDTTTGAMRFGDAKSETWKIVQKGDPKNDFVAAPHLDPAVAVTDFIRIRAWAQLRTVLFMRYGLSMVITGTCKPMPHRPDRPTMRVWLPHPLSKTVHQRHLTPSGQPFDPDKAATRLSREQFDQSGDRIQDMFVAANDRHLRS